jgi:uncharacterized RDD family membrane protein YckC
MVYCKNCGTPLDEGIMYCPKCGTPLIAQQVPTTQASYGTPVASGLKLATWGERFVAWLIDSIILSVIIGILSIFTYFMWTPLGFWPSWTPFFNFSTGGVIYFLYWLIMDGTYGQSLGKMIMHLKVSRLDSRPINMSNAAVESAGKAFLLPLDIILGLILYPNRKQRLFNYISETVVIRE